LENAVVSFIVGDRCVEMAGGNRDFTADPSERLPRAPRKSP
jgi:hypothetical protein